MPDNAHAADPGRRVAFASCASYDARVVTDAVAQALAPLGGIEAFVRPGMRVLLKPNLVMPMAAEKAACTHPSVVEAVGRMVVDCGATLLVGDSPGIASARKVAETCGIADTVKRLGGTMVEFTLADAPPRSGMDDSDGVRLARADMAREVFEADCLINLPKFKSHAMTMMSLGVKNCFGCVVGARKFQWHCRAGHSPELFGRMLVDVWRAAAPALTILDGVIGMEGEGPTGGTPRTVGLVAAARNAALLDMACAPLVGLDPDAVLTSRMAHMMGLARPEDIDLCGEDAGRFVMPDFRLPALDQGFHMLPRWLNGAARRWFTSRPEPDPDNCTGCGRCAEICPAKAIVMEQGLPRIDVTQCIRCYCCHEFCPPHAMRKRAPWLLRLIGMARRGR